jgi:hypothetical protein
MLLDEEVDFTLAALLLLPLDVVLLQAAINRASSISTTVPATCRRAFLFLERWVGVITIACPP